MTGMRLQRGFTLVEVMLALAILVGALVVLMRGTAGNIATADRSYMLGVATGLARAKMYDIEEELLKEGFSDLDEQENGDFSDEGWPHIEWEVEIIRPEIPDLAGMVQAMQDGESVPGTGEDDALSAGIEMGLEAQGGGFAAMMPPFLLRMLQSVLEEAVRKVELTVTWETALREESMLVEAYFTEPKHVSAVVGGLGRPAPGDDDVSDVEGDGDDGDDRDDAGGGRRGGMRDTR